MTYHKTLQRFLNVHNFPESGKGAPPDRILKNLCRCHCSRVVLQDSPSDQRQLLGMRSDGESLSLHDFWGIMASALISSLNPGTTFYRSLESYAITACPCIISWMFLYIHLSLYVVYRGVPWSIGRELCTKTKKYLAALHLLSILRDLHVKVHHSFHAFFWGEEPTAICQCEPKKEGITQLPFPEQIEKEGSCQYHLPKAFQIFSDCLLCHRTETSGLKDSPRPKAFRHFQCGTYNAIPTWPTTWGSLGTIAR